MPTAIITRRRNDATPGRVGKFAWKWLYDATDENGQEIARGYSALRSIRGYVRRLGFTDIRDGWRPTK